MYPMPKHHSTPKEKKYQVKQTILDSKIQNSEVFVMCITYLEQKVTVDKPSSVS